MNKVILFVPLFILSVVSCSPRQEYMVIDGETQGTTYHIVVGGIPGLERERLQHDISEVLDRVDHSLSIYNDSSIITAINSNRSNLTDTLFREVLRIAAEVNTQSEGLFDITIGPLVKSWGFGTDASERFDPSLLDSLMRLVGMDKLHLEGERIIKSEPGIFIDVNAIAPGYTVDLLTALISRSGSSQFLVEVGGEVRTEGNKYGNGWYVGIDAPVDGNMTPGADMQAKIRLDGRALATSGNYRRFYVEDGIKYAHTIDPRTGYPVRHTLLSATIVAPEAAVADAWATACMVAGREKAVEFIEKYDFLEGYLIWSDDNGDMQGWISEGLKELLTEQP